MNTVDWSHWMTNTDAQNAALRRQHRDEYQAMADDNKTAWRKSGGR